MKVRRELLVGWATAADEALRMADGTRTALREAAMGLAVDCLAVREAISELLTFLPYLATLSIGCTFQHFFVHAPRSERR